MTRSAWSLAAALLLVTTAAACSSGKSNTSTVRSTAADAAAAPLPPVAVPDAAVAALPPVVAKREPRIVVSTCFPLGALAKTPLGDEQQSLAPHYDPGRWRPAPRIVPVSSRYAHATVRTFLASNEAALTACYPADSQLAGEALVSVVVTADGLVKQAATLGLADAGIEQCLTAAVQGLKLPAPGKLAAFGCRLTVGRSTAPRTAPPTLRLRLGGDLAETHGELKRARLDLELSDGPADARAPLAGRAILQVDAAIESGAVASMIRSALVAGYTRVVLASSDDGGTTWHPVVEIVTAPELAVAPRGAPIVLVGQDGVQLAALGATEKPRLVPVAELTAALAALGPAKPLQVAGAANVPFSTLAIALRAVVRAGFTDVTLVPATRLAFQFAP